MTKIKLSILWLVALLLSSTIFISCSKDETTNNETQNLASLGKESLLLKKTYGFENISFKIDKSKSLMFKSSANLDKLTLKKSSNSHDLDVSNITEINWKNHKISYLIPFINNPKKSLVITIGTDEIGKTLNFATAKMIENTIDPKNGNGHIILTDIEGSTDKTFENGVLKRETNLYGRTFRECFDTAYNDICDGFIGCAAWYSSPLPALTAVAYCGATT